MEEDIFMSTPIAGKKKLETRLKKAVDIAQERLDYESAHNAVLLKGLSIVHNFIKTKKRVCYGGTAMNMILPVEKRFYNPDVDLPDYDFFTPDLDGDVNSLVAELHANGFKNVHHKIGIHEGTSKVLINFVAIADITRISPPLFAILLKRAYKRDSMYYTDPDILRMMMYLELSRPRGMVSRWEKVYDRLQLINRNFPPKLPKARNGTRKAIHIDISEPVKNKILNFCMEKGRIFFTGPLEEFYRNVIHGHRDIFDTGRLTGIIGVLSPDVKDDALLVKQLLGNTHVEVFFQGAKGEFVPPYVEIRYKHVPVLLMLQEVACSSFLSFNTQDGLQIHIASLDTLITIWYSIAIFTKNLHKRIPDIDAIIPRLVSLTEMNRLSKKPRIPPFSLECSGYQKGYPTLLREKFIRARELKGEHKTPSTT